MNAKTTIICAGLVSLLTSLSACGTDFAVEDQVLTGTVAGQPWTFMRGDTSAFLSDEEAFFVALYAEDFTPCDFSAPEPPHLLLLVPREPGEYDMSFSRSMTFVVGPGENLIATKGVIATDSVTADTLRGGIHSQYDGDNEVNGTFEVTICPGDMQ